MIEKIKKRLQRKIIIITGGSESERAQFINQLISDTNLYIYRPPKRIGFNDYIAFIRKNSIEHIVFDKTKKLDLWENLSFHKNWSKGNDCLIILEEPNFDDIYGNTKLLWIRDVIEIFDHHNKGQKFPRLIISQDDISDVSYHRLTTLPDNNYLTTDSERTSEQIINQNIDFINLSEY